MTKFGQNCIALPNFFPDSMALYIFIMIIIMGWWQISYGKLSPTATDLNTIVTNLSPNRQWLIVGMKSVVANYPIPHIYMLATRFKLVSLVLSQHKFTALTRPQRSKQYCLQYIYIYITLYESQFF